MYNNFDIDRIMGIINRLITFCFLGNYNSEYSRNRVLIRGLEENGVTVFQCNDENKGIKL